MKSFHQDSKEMEKLYIPPKIFQSIFSYSQNDNDLFKERKSASEFRFL
ncbi:hypothetical protein [Leptospira noguchii]|nr:hypothetical protein [Leptospira noguchii]UOG41167.1 hypothetical protein MAL05_15315 [Leptospira noguchii]